MHVFDVAVTSVVTLESILGQPTVTSVSCQASVGGVNAQFYGGARCGRSSGKTGMTGAHYINSLFSFTSWIFQHFVNQYMDRVRGEIEEKVGVPSSFVK